MSTVEKYVVNTDTAIARTDEDIFVSSAQSMFKLPGSELWEFILTLIEREEPISSAEVTSPYDQERLSTVLAMLADAGVLVRCDGDDLWPATVLNLYNRAAGTRSHEEISDRLSAGVITIVADPGSSIVTKIESQLQELLKSAHTTVEVITTPEDVQAHTSQVILAVADDLADGVLDKVNEQALEESWRIWAPVTPAQGNRFVIGPWYYPNASACHQCYRLRRASTQQAEGLSTLMLDGQSVSTVRDPFASQPAISNLIASLVSDSAVQHLGLDGAHGQATFGGYTEFVRGLNGLEVAHHRVLRVPRCEACSPAQGTGYPQIWFHEEGERQED